MTLWQRAHSWVLKAEGGFFNHPRDPGGPTYAGVSLRAVVALDVNRDGVLDFDLDGDGDVDLQDIRALEHHPEKVEEFYRARYWDAVRADDLGWPFPLLAFDAAVHHGPGPAIVLVQRAVGVTPDGRMGPATIRATIDAPAFHVRRYFAERSHLLFRIAIKQSRRDGIDPADHPFFKGWAKRLFDLHAESGRS